MALLGRVRRKNGHSGHGLTTFRCRFCDARIKNSKQRGRPIGSYDLRKGIAEDLALCPAAERAALHAALVTEVANAERTHQTAAATLDALRLSTPDPAEIERRRMRCNRLEQALENRNDELRQLERDIGRLTGQIQTVATTGKMSCAAPPD